MKLNTTSSKPLYMQLKEFIKEDIRSGKYKPGEKLPSEPELCDIYSVSRITIRRAILDLVETGVLTRQQGKGTFVSRKKIKRELIDVNGFSQFVENLGEVPNTQVLTCTTVEANKLNDDIINALKVGHDAPILELVRLHYLREDPLILEKSYYSLARFPNLEKHITDNPSTYKTLRENYYISPYYNKKTLNIRTSDSDIAVLLKIPHGEPLFEIQEIVSCELEAPIHYSVSLLPSNKVSFTLDTSLKRN